MSTMHKLAHILKNDKDRMFEILEEMEEKFGDLEEFFTCHIDNIETYNKFVSVLKNFDGTTGGHWKPEDIKASVQIDFNTKEYTCYDYAYVANMKYSDDGHRFKSNEMLFDSARDYLEDVDYWGIPSERAYREGKKRYERFKKG
jgi:hypothetical protein